MKYTTKTQGFVFGFAGYILTSILGLAVYSPHEFTFRAEEQVSSCTVGLS